MKFLLRFFILTILIPGVFIYKISGRGLSIEFDESKDTCKCNYKCLPMNKDSINSIAEGQILSFLQSLGHDCDNNVEFSEYSNEILFKVIESSSARFMAVVERYHTNIEFASILHMIENPINDGIDLNKILKLVKSTKSNSLEKKKIVDSIHLAIDKTK